MTKTAEKIEEPTDLEPESPPDLSATVALTPAMLAALLEEVKAVQIRNPPLRADGTPGSAAADGPEAAPAPSASEDAPDDEQLVEQMVDQMDDQTDDYDGRGAEGDPTDKLDLGFGGESP